MRYRLPHGMRYASLVERREFYRKEFDLRELSAWFDLRPVLGRIVFAVIIGRHTRIYPKMYEDDRSTTIIVSKYRALEDVKDQILEFAPESVYYDRNIYTADGAAKGQELAFDVDPENMTCPIHGTFADRARRRQGLAFCEIELEMVKEETAKAYEMLQEHFADLRIVYSGRGFHIHVFDREAFTWTAQKRRFFARELKKKIPIDEWVTSGAMRLIRLPYSLHAMVSRVVIPLNVAELRRFDPVKDLRCLPQYLRRRRAI